MIIGIKDLIKLFSIVIVSSCAVFVCTLFLNYNIDLIAIKDEITSQQGMIVFNALVATGKVVAGISGGCLIITTIILLIFYIKNYIDSHGKELGILKALGYSNFRIAKHFWIFGLTTFVGCILGFIAAFCYMPTFYKVQNSMDLLPQLLPQFHLILIISLIILPTIFFAMLSIIYALIKLKKPVIELLKDLQIMKKSIKKIETKEYHFLKELKRNTLKSKKTLIFFIIFSAFCFSAMTQMSLSMNDLSSESFSWMIISIGLILAFMTLMMSLTSVIKANTKTIAMMKVFGYSKRECSSSILGGFRPLSYIGFVIGTLYQYILLKIMVNIVFADFENIPEYTFNFQTMIITFIFFIITYETIIFFYSKKIEKQSIKGIMLE